MISFIILPAVFMNIALGRFCNYCHNSFMIFNIYIFQGNKKKKIKTIV